MWNCPLMLSSMVAQSWVPTTDPSRIHLIPGVEVTNKWSCTSTTTYALVVCTGTAVPFYNIGFLLLIGSVNCSMFTRDMCAILNKWMEFVNILWDCTFQLYWLLITTLTFSVTVWTIQLVICIICWGYEIVCGIICNNNNNRVHCSF